MINIIFNFLIKQYNQLFHTGKTAILNQKNPPQKEMDFFLRSSVLKPCHSIFKKGLHHKFRADGFIVVHPFHNIGKQFGTAYNPYFFAWFFKRDGIGYDQFQQL